MQPILHPSLINGRSGDPALYVETLFEKRAILFDLGDVSALPARKIHRLEHIFVSHAHIDHCGLLPRLTNSESIKHVLLQYQKSLKAEFGDIIKKDAGIISIKEEEIKEEEDLQKAAEEMPVISQQGVLFGKVFKVYKNYSKIMYRKKQK